MHFLAFFHSLKKKSDIDWLKVHFFKYPISWYTYNDPIEARESDLKLFEDGQTRILVTTQVLARGVAFNDVNVVINFDVPTNTPHTNDTQVDRPIFILQMSRCTQLDKKGFAITLTDQNSPEIQNELSFLGIRSIKI